ncbi:MAG: hypothetical protein WD055_00080 [Candidatus Dependentiae bacterium]
MNNVRLSILASCFILLNLNAELKQNPNTFRYYTVPNAPGINQGEYHQMVWICKNIIKQHYAYMTQFAGGGRSSYGLNGAQWKTTEYLQQVATPTSARLLADLKQINFNI